MRQARAMGERWIPCVCLAAAVLAGCDKKAATPLAPAASALTASAPVAASWHYAVDPKSTTQIDMPGVKEHIKGNTTAATGTLHIVPTDLSRSPALVLIALPTFITHTFASDEDS